MASGEQEVGHCTSVSITKSIYTGQSVSFCLCLAGQEQHGPVGLGVDKGHKDCQKAGPPLLWERGGRVGVVQAEKEKALGRPYNVNNLITGRLGRSSNN